MEKTIITVTGKDAVGIIAGVCTCLAEENINILDITQTIIGGIFNMMMIVDTEASSLDFARLNDRLQHVAASFGVTIHVQREAIFDRMHRV